MLEYLKEKFKSKSEGAVLAAGSINTFLIRLAGAVLQLGTHVLIARTIGSDQYGIFVYIMSWMLLLILVSKLGFDTSLLRFAAAYKANKEWGLLRGILKTSNKLALISSITVSLIVAVIMIVLNHKIPEIITSDLLVTSLIACLVLPVITIMQIHQAFLRSMLYIVQGILPEFIVQPLTLGLIALIAFFGLCLQRTASVAMTLYFISFLCALIVILRWSYRILKSEAEPAKEETRFREWISVSLPLLMMAGFNLINARADVIMVGFFLGTTQAGFYAVAVKYANFLTWGFISINVTAAPLISNLYAQKKMAELQRTASLAALGIIIYAIPAGTIMILCGSWLLGLFPPEFKIAYDALVILIIGQCVCSLAGSVGYLLTMTRYQKEAAIVIGIAAPLNIALNYVLIPKYGLVGAAIATATSTFFWNFTMYIIARKSLGIDSTVIGLLRKIKQ